MALVGLWGLVVGVGLFWLAVYDHQPSDAGNPMPVWPAETRLVRVAERKNLIVWLHPRCPCSRATLSELQRVLARYPERAALQIVLVRPGSTPRGWEQTGLAKQAAAIPGARIVVDEAGVEADRFGIVTSGHVSLYDRSGRLLFNGGITAARGHEGDNLGSQALLALLADHDQQRRPTTVFGCSLLSPVRQNVERTQP